MRLRIVNPCSAPPSSVRGEGRHAQRAVLVQRPGHDWTVGVGLAAVDNVGAIASDAKHRVDSGVETLSQSVARNPITAIAIAAGVGLLFGMMNRSGHRR